MATEKDGGTTSTADRDSSSRRGGRRYRRLCCRRHVTGTAAISTTITAGGMRSARGGRRIADVGTHLHKRRAGHASLIPTSAAAGEESEVGGRKRQGSKRGFFLQPFPLLPQKPCKSNPPPGQTCRTLPMILKGAFWRHFSRGARGTISWATQRPRRKWQQLTPWRRWHLAHLA